MCGHRKHVRVVINGHFAYNRGGRAFDEIMNCVYHNRYYDPLRGNDEHVHFGLHYMDKDHLVVLRPDEVKTIKLIFIVRTRRGLRRVTESVTYVYDNGGMSSEIMRWHNCTYNKDEHEYRCDINKWR